jgi:uncharacterized protein YcbX
VSTADPHLARIAVYPIKSLDPLVRDRARIVENAALEPDRECAVVDGEGEYVNGKRTAAVHRVRADFDRDVTEVTLRRQGSRDGRTYGLPDERGAAADWLGDHFGTDVRLIRDPEGGYPDDTDLSGPTLISTGTVEEIASWYDLDPESVRLRFRANLEVGGVPPFWEDRLLSDRDHCVAVRIGDAELWGVNPCQRCVVPSRDPYTGAETEGFRETFLRKREETFPEWADPARFDHYFRVMINTLVPESEWGTELAVGDEIEILGERPLSI